MRRQGEDPLHRLSDSWGVLQAEDDFGIISDDERRPATGLRDESGRGIQQGQPDQHQPCEVARQHQSSTEDHLHNTPLRKPTVGRGASVPTPIAEPQFVMPSPSTAPYGEYSWIDTMAEPSPSRPIRRKRASPEKRTAKKAPVVASETESDSMNGTPVHRRVSRKSKRRSDRASDGDEASGSPVTLLWTHFLGPILKYSAGVLGHSLKIVQPLFGYLLLAAAVIMAVRYAFGSVPFLGSLVSFVGFLNPFKESMTAMMAPLRQPCSLPIISVMPWCQGSHSVTQQPQFEQLMHAQASFEEILQSAAYGIQLPADMKRSEASIRDLKYIVSYSNLPSRSELVLEFDDFITTARSASSSLTKFNSRIGRAVDHIISINRNTLRVLDGVAEYESSRGTIDRFLASALFPLNQLSSGSSAEVTSRQLFDQYLKHTAKVEEQINHLIAEAQVLLAILQNLDDRLDVIHSVCARDGLAISENREEMLAKLWTMLGGNKKQVDKMNNSLKLLGAVGQYRKQAYAHVSATMLKLEAIAAELEELRERVAKPGLMDDTFGLGYGEEVEISLLQHIETIQAGVKRLDEQRGVHRAIEQDGYRKILDSGGSYVDDRKDRMIGHKDL